MPVALDQIREQLLPGLRNLQFSFKITEEIWAANVFNAAQPVAATVSLPVAVAMGAAAVIMNNPVVSRRLLP